MKLPLLAVALAATLASFATAHAVQEEKEHANLGRWRIMEVSDQGRFLYCAADTDNGRVQLRLATDGRTWQVGVPYYDNGPVKGQWGFDGWEDETMFQTHGDGWAVMEANQHILDSFRQMDNFSIEFDRGPQNFNLKGSSAALKKAVDCARNKGRRAAAKADAVSDGVSWVKGRPGKPVDPRAVAVGTMADGLRSSCASLTLKGGLHPGMTGMWIEGCSTGYGGREVTFAKLQRNDRNRPLGACRQRAGARLLRSRAETRPTARRYLSAARKSTGSTYAGKTRPGFDGCNIPDLGQERTIRSFEVLVP